MTTDKSSNKKLSLEQLEQVSGGNFAEVEIHYKPLKDKENNHNKWIDVLSVNDGLHKP